MGKHLPITQTTDPSNDRPRRATAKSLWEIQLAESNGTHVDHLPALIAATEELEEAEAAMQDNAAPRGWLPNRIQAWANIRGDDRELALVLQHRLDRAGDELEAAIMELEPVMLERDLLQRKVDGHEDYRPLFKCAVSNYSNLRAALGCNSQQDSDAVLAEARRLRDRDDPTSIGVKGDPSPPTFPTARVSVEQLRRVASKVELSEPFVEERHIDLVELLPSLIDLALERDGLKAAVDLSEKQRPMLKKAMLNHPQIRAAIGCDAGQHHSEVLRVARELASQAPALKALRRAAGKFLLSHGDLIVHKGDGVGEDFEALEEAFNATGSRGEVEEEQPPTTGTVSHE